MLWLFAGLAGSCCLAQSAYRESKISPYLKSVGNEGPKLFHDIIIQLGDRPDIDALLGNRGKNGLSQGPISHDLIVNLTRHAHQSQSSLLAWMRQADNIEPASIKSYWIANVIACRANMQAVRRLSLRPEVAGITIDFTLQLDDGQAPYAFSPAGPQGHEPGHDIIRAPGLWSLGYTGYGRKVLILDSGTDLSHPALIDQYWGNYVADSLSWYDPAGGSKTPLSCGVHGNQVAGIILGLDPQTRDTLGVAFNSNWMASPVAPDPGQCQATDAIAALQWALNPDGNPNTVDDMPDVINNSWSLITPGPGQECQSVFKDILDVLEAAGIAVVWSAGNQGPGYVTIASPKNINTNPVNAFCVGAIRGSVAGYPIFPNSSRGPSLCQLSSDTIKPEVVAPGAGIRSCGLNGTFTSSSGTSFSTPHVSGAVLLLKEAFPFLSGKDLLMAIYLTGQDLGQTGEDNLYGNGLIDIMAAYQYLVGQGNTPVTVSWNNDVAIEHLKSGRISHCDSIILPSFTLINRGTDSLRQLKILYRYSPGLEDSLNWTGSLPPDSQTLVFLPLFLPPHYGTFSLSVHLIQPNNTPDYHYLDNRISTSFSFLPPPPAVISPSAICLGRKALLKATPDSGQVVWFADSLTDVPLGSGIRFISGPLWSDTSFYVAANINGLWGCRSKIYLRVDSGQVIAAFEMSDSVLYLKQSGQIAFADRSIDAKSWLWDFGDGTGSTLQDPVHTYADTGVFGVSLSVTGADLCSDVSFDTVTVLSWSVNSSPLFEAGISVFPNPCIYPCELKINSNRHFIRDIRLSSIYGQVLKSWGKDDLPQPEAHLVLPDLPAGIYTLRIIAQNNSFIFRIRLL